MTTTGKTTGRVALARAAQVYVPEDWRQRIASGEVLAERTSGAALFADISGFTPLTETLTSALGQRRGAEQLTHHLNQVFDALIAEVNRYGGASLALPATR
ncbi:MAG: hypothetical protein Q7O66_22590 [Dehalococcoidia bacterium]|nr:hypothetical protein [Dehalococcoidia bacterium]